MSSQFRLSHLSLAFIATLSSPALLAQSVEKERDKVPIQATDLPVDGTPQALVLGETRVLGTAAEELKQSIKRGLDEANPTADISAALRDAVHGPAKPPEPPATTDGQH